MPKLYGIVVGDALTGAQPGHRAVAKYRLDFSGYVAPSTNRPVRAEGGPREVGLPLVPVQLHCICGTHWARRLGLTPVFRHQIEVNFYNGQPLDYADLYATLDRVTVMASEHTLRGVRFTEPREIAQVNRDQKIEYSRPLDLKIFVVDNPPQVVMSPTQRSSQQASFWVPGDYFCLGADFLGVHFRPPALQFERPSWSPLKRYPFVRAKVSVPNFCEGRTDPDAILATTP